MLRRMDEQPRKFPEAPPEVGPEVPGSRWLTMPAITELLGMSERAARDWVRRHKLPVHGSRPVRVSEQVVLAQMAAEERVARKPPEASPEASGSYREAPGSAEPIEAAYRVAGEAAAEVALVPLATMVEELRGLADQLNDMARRNEALALAVGQLRERQVGQQSQLLAKDETIAELRRRAEVAEAELSRRRENAEAELFRQRNDQEAAQVVQDGLGTPEAIEATDDPRRGCGRGCGGRGGEREALSPTGAG
jgi:hypothetical protein